MALDHRLAELDDEIDKLRKKQDKDLDHWTRRNAKMVDYEAEVHNEEGFQKLEDYEAKKEFLKNQEKELRINE